ncbi:Glycoside hydrolase, 38 vacuolar alpha mannosidase [Coemansia sp. Benny D160-2]|nr:Glycoside hydrolase, 38 vacuolar alpha mannosidase [Coemansia sp. Benny D160-2]
MKDTSMSSVQKHPSISKGRIQAFLQEGQWEDVNINSVLYDARVSAEPYVRMEAWSAPDQSRPGFAQAAQQTYSAISVGHTFGNSWTTHWVRVRLRIPKEMEGRQVRFLFDPGCEAMVWTADGEPVQGITGGEKSCLHVDHILTNKATAADMGEERVLLYEVACNHMFGNGAFIIGPPEPSREFKLTQAELVVMNTQAWAMKMDLNILLDMYNTLPKSQPRAWEALHTANAMVNAFDADDTKTIDAALAISNGFFAQKGGEANHQVFAIGNCHIDTAWLWPYDETKRKIARSWSTQVDYMDRYPEYKFAASQAQQFEWLRVLYPTLFKRVQDKVKTGQFIPIGGTWIEMDCNIPSGESLVRQFLLGQRFFQKHFAVRTDVFWLPDTFGYSSQLPQIVRLAGAKYFFTQKLSWNNLNVFPHTTFRWIGLDGSNVLTHMAPANTYTATAVAREVIASVGRHKDIAYTNESLYLYGNGDGGGGPLETMLDRLERMKDVDGLPRIKHEDPSKFYSHVEKTSKGLVSWKGELYLEFHRGTYTSQAKTKKFNRQCELLLRDVEMLSALAKVGAFGFEYPATELERLWQIVCLNQFHDVIPGTSIGMVYKDTDRMYADVVASATGLKQNALVALFNNVSVDAVDAASGMLFVNTTMWPRTDVVAVGGLAHDGVQQFRKHDGAALVVAASVPGLATKAVGLDANANASADVVPVSVFSDSRGNVVLENLYVVARINTQGQLVSLWDKASEREVVADGQRANVFQLQEDMPILWDAWDIEIYSNEKKKDLPGSGVTVVDEGPLVASVSFEVAIGKQSTLRQVVSLSATSPRLDFACDVDWHENHKCLRVAFAWDIHSDVATYETQFGVERRPTHRNTSWDMAKFEVCAQRFADLSEYGYGVALLNDCKYGYSTLANTMCLTLLRSPKAPDENCDMGNHSFRYAVYPHKGAFDESDVLQEAYKFNVPLVSVPIDYSAVQAGLSAVMAGLSLSGAPNVVLDTVKMAEDSPSCLVVRMYEAHGGHARASLATRLNVTAAEKTNILEEKIEALKVVPPTASSKGCKSIDIRFKPFEIITVKLVVKQ